MKQLTLAGFILAAFCLPAHAGECEEGASLDAFKAAVVELHATVVGGAVYAGSDSDTVVLYTLGPAVFAMFFKGGCWVGGPTPIAGLAGPTT